MRLFLIFSALVIFNSYFGSEAKAQAQDSAAAGNKKITICVPAFREELMTLSLMAAKDNQFFAKNGLDVEFKTVWLASNGVAKKKDRKKAKHNVAGMLHDHGVADHLMSKNAECMIGTSVIERFLRQDQEVLKKTQPLLLTSYGQDYDTQLIVPTKSPVKDVKDLKGRMVRLGQIPTFIAMEAIMKEAGMTINDIDRDNMTDSIDVLAKLESGELQAAVTYVPTMPYMLATGKVRVLKPNIVRNNIHANIPHSLLIANREFAQKSPEVVRGVINAVKEANAWFARNPSQILYTYQKHTEALNKRTWNIDKVTAEKAATYIGAINSVDVFGEANTAERMSTLNEVNNYMDLLIKGDFITRKVELRPWLGLPAADAKTAAL